MKHQLMFTVLALLVSSGVYAETPDQDDQLSAMVRMTSASYAGSNNRCPRFKYIEGTMAQEMKEYGLDKISDSERRDMHKSAFALVFLTYEENQSKFCSAVWNMLGPDGTYKRQMLQAK